MAELIDRELIMHSSRRTLIVIAAALVLVAAVASGVAYPHLPPSVPTHWNLRGQPNGFSGPLGAALTMPIIMLVTAVLLIVAPSFDGAWFIRYRNRESGDSTAKPVYALIALLVLGAMLAMHLLMLGTALSIVGAQAAPRLRVILLSLILIALGNYLPQVTQRNAFIGVRLPWAYASEEVWRRTQRIGGYGMVLVGFVGLIASVVVAGHAWQVLSASLLIYIVAISLWSYGIAHSARVP